jgi:hypothetical protein
MVQPFAFCPCETSSYLPARESGMNSERDAFCQETPFARKRAANCRTDNHDGWFIRLDFRQRMVLFVHLQLLSGTTRHEVFQLDFGAFSGNQPR